MVLTSEEFDALTAACRAVPLTETVYEDNDIVSALQGTVIDYMMTTTAVRRAYEHFGRERQADLRTMDDLRAFVARFPDTEEGNVELALQLWGYRLWTRARQLRGLVVYFDRLGISTMEGLRDWARTTTFKDFEGQVRGLGPAVYQWLTMRLGVQTAKGDVRLIRFVARAVGRPVNESEAVRGVEEAARRMNVPVRTLDWSIWEHEGDSL